MNANWNKQTDGICNQLQHLLRVRNRPGNWCYRRNQQKEESLKPALGNGGSSVRNQVAASTSAVVHGEVVAVALENRAMHRPTRTIAVLS